MADSKHEKSQLRAILRQQRQDLDPQQQQAAAAAVAEQLVDLPPWQSALRVALYLPADGEIDTRDIAALCRQQDKQIFLPVIQADRRLHFARWAAGAPLTRNRFGIAEPPDSAPRCSPQNLDIICMPLVGWDRCGGRLGMGGGFYDRTLEGVEGPTLVGLAHAQQEVDAIPLDSWDRRLDFIATDTTLHECRGIHSG